MICIIFSIKIKTSLLGETKLMHCFTGQEDEKNGSAVGRNNNNNS